MERSVFAPTDEWDYTPAKVAGSMSEPSLKIGSIILWGGGEILDLPLIEASRSGVYLTFQEGTRVTEGEIFRIVRPLWWHDDPTLTQGHVRRVVAEVRVLRTTNSARTLVEVLRGSVIRGISAERVPPEIQP